MKFEASHNSYKHQNIFHMKFRIIKFFRFSIIDMMVYIFLISLSLPFCIDKIKTDDYFKMPTGSLAMRIFITWHCVSAIVPIIFFTHVAWILVNVKNNTYRAQLLDPGFGSGLIAMAVVFFKTIGVFALWTVIALDENDGSLASFVEKLCETEWNQRLNQTYYELQSEIGVLIISLWTLLIFSKQWKSNSTGNGLLGRFLGLFWILLVPLSWFSNAFD